VTGGNAKFIFECSNIIDQIFLFDFVMRKNDINFLFTLMHHQVASS